MRNAWLHIQRCPHCACISVNLGPMTIRLDDEALLPLSDAFLEAHRAVQDERQARSTPPHARA